jgi:hypothetical protein
MGKLSGCVLILAGLAVAAYALYPQPQAGSELAAQSVPVGAHDGVVPVKAAGGPSTTGDKADPAMPSAMKPAIEPSKADKGEKSGPPPAPALMPSPNLVPPVLVPAKRPRSAVAAVDVDGAPQRVPVGDSKAAAPPLDGAALTREIQRHLKRIGCYRGDVSGVWSPAVRQAMQAFTERANATLPVNGPDPVLLAMVQSHAPGVCSATCPQGQDRAANGRCVPSALVAAAAAKGGSKSVKASADVVAKKDVASKGGPASPAVSSAAPDPTAAAPPPSARRAPDGRMSLAGPPAQAKAMAPRRQARVAGWSRTAQSRQRARRSYTGYSGLPSWAFPFFMP